MNIKRILLFTASVFLLSACGAAISSPLTGSWERQGTYVNGELQHQALATIVISDGQFSNTTEICTVSGTYEEADGQITVTMTESDCPSPLQLPYSITYDYTLEGKTLNMISQGIREEYLKQ